MLLSLARWYVAALVYMAVELGNHLTDVALGAGIAASVPMARPLMGTSRKGCGMGRVRYSVVVSYQPMSLAELARFIAAEPDFDTRWRLVVEFLKEYHREPAGGACSLPTTRSTPRERSLATARPRGHRGGVPPSWRPACQPRRGGRPLCVRRCCDGPCVRLAQGHS